MPLNLFGKKSSKCSDKSRLEHKLYLVSKDRLLTFTFVRYSKTKILWDSGWQVISLSGPRKPGTSVWLVWMQSDNRSARNIFFMQSVQKGVSVPAGNYIFKPEIIFISSTSF
jgi:hypothetical protein